jgi:hypothetical protein
MSTGRSLKGSLTALVTPFLNGKLDQEAFRSHVSWQIENGTTGLVPVGTTGESPTLTSWWLNGALQKPRGVSLLLLGPAQTIPLKLSILHVTRKRQAPTPFLSSHLIITSQRKRGFIITSKQ